MRAPVLPSSQALIQYPRPRPGNGFKLPATWQAGRQLGRHFIPLSGIHLRASAGLPASLPPERSGPVFSKFLASFRHFALDHTHHPRRKAPPRRAAQGKASTRSWIRAPNRPRGRVIVWHFRTLPNGGNVTMRRADPASPHAECGP